MTYLVTGATGNVGSEVVRALAAAGEDVRALSRRGSVDGLPAGVTAVAGDLDAPATVIEALDGVSGLFLMPGYSGTAEVLAGAFKAGVRRGARLWGGRAASGDRSNAVTAYMLAAEDEVTGSGLAWTIVRPYAFASNALRWVPQLAAGDVVREPFGWARSAVVDPADIGAVLAAGLVSDAHAGRRYVATGPEPLLPAERLAILGEVLGRDLRLEAMSAEESRAGLPPAYADAFTDFYVAGSLDESRPTSDVEDVLGRPPRSFRQWSEAHRAAFT